MLHIDKTLAPNVLKRISKLGAPPEFVDKSRPRKYKDLKYPKDSVWNLPDINESLWETVPTDDELFKHAHYMDRNKSYRTTYGKMNEWRKMPGGTEQRSGVPVTLTDSGWRESRQGDAPPADHRKKNDDYNVKFRDSYADLTSKIAYRFPNPGLPRLRQGRIGGSWRHIKEVLGHGGSRVVYVDGLVGVYDEENFNQSLNSQLPYRPHLRRNLYSPNRGFLKPDRREPVTQSDPVHLPAVEELPMMSANERARKMAIQSPNKHKGVYAYN